MDTVFVTGATGFIGANLIRTLLDRGFSVRALVRMGSDKSNLKGLNIDIIDGSLESYPAVAAGCRGARYVFHVAADYRIWVRDPRAMFVCNVQGTVRVLE